MRYIRLIVGVLVTAGLSSGPVLASSPAAKTLITGAKAALPYSYAGFRVVETTRTGESRVVNEAGDVDARMVYASTIKPFYLAAANALLHERRGASFSYFTTPLLTKYLGTKTLQEIAAPLITEQPTGGASNDALVNLRELIARELGGAALPMAQRTRMANDWIQRKSQQRKGQIQGAEKKYPSWAKNQSHEIHLTNGK